MLRNYLKIAYRNLLRSKAFSAINIVGLAFGLATCLIIGLFVLDELSFDRFHEKADRIVRVTFKANMSGNKINEANVMPPTAKTLQREYPEVLEATRLRQSIAFKLLKDEGIFKENAVAFVDSNFFQVFSFPLVKGNPKTALLRPNTLVISQKMAQKYFGNEDPIGKTLTNEGYEAMEITGVMEEWPVQSHFHYDFLISMAGLNESRSNSWMQSEYFTYLVLPEGYDYQKLQSKLPQVVEKYMGPEIKQAFGMNYAEFRKKGNELGLILQPLTDIHLRSDFAYDLGPSGDIRYVYIFGAIALFMLLIACINFMNLSTAGASRRAREVGIRKVMGSVRGTLVGQFLLESILLTAVALVLAVVLVWLALPFFNGLADKNLTLSFTEVPWLLPGLLLLGLVVGILAGSYPAFFLSSFKPISVLKGGTHLNFSKGRHSISLRGTLVVVQFCISIILIVGTTVVYQQLHFIQNTKLGYDKAQVLVVQGTYRLGQNEQLFRKQLLQDSRVVDATVSGYVPAGPSLNNNFMVYGDDKVNEFTKGIRYDVDESYIPTLGMTMAAGRNFSPDFATDSSAIILNETAAREMGWGKEAIGHTVTRPNNEGTKTTYRVIGVVKDFHFKSLHERITPLMMTLGHNGGAILAKVKTRDLPALLTSVEKQWKTLVADEPLDYSFLEENFNATYRAEQKTARILGLFAGLTIFVACLGLFGLATFTAEQRTKEIGVRKVLGASVTSVVALLSKDFLKLVAIAIVIASPIAWYTMNAWLQDFAYKIDISWWVFALAGLLAVAIALFTVSFQSVRAALRNPVESLQSE